MKIQLDGFKFIMQAECKLCLNIFSFVYSGKAANFTFFNPFDQVRMDHTEGIPVDNPIQNIYILQHIKINSLKNPTDQ